MKIVCYIEPNEKYRMMEKSIKSYFFVKEFPINALNGTIKVDTIQFNNLTNEYVFVPKTDVDAIAFTLQEDIILNLIKSELYENEIKARLGFRNINIIMRTMKVNNGGSLEDVTGLEYPFNFDIKKAIEIMKDIYNFYFITDAGVVDVDGNAVLVNTLQENLLIKTNF